MNRRRASLLAGLSFIISVWFPLAASAAPRPVPASPVNVAAYAAVLRQYNPAMPDWQSKDLARHLIVSAARWKVDTNMLAAIITVESSWHTHAVSGAGAVGLGQLMPGTAATLGVNPRDPVENIQGAARYLRGLLERFGHKKNRYELAFAAYNAGPIAVQRYNGIPPYSETQNYVVKVLRAWNQLRGIVRLPKAAFTTASAPRPRGADIDYWLNGQASQ
jgi:soluble lytic murein transglycosylase-like protein